MTKRPRGRPPLPEAERSTSIHVRVPAWVISELTADGEGVSAAARRVLESWARDVRGE